MNSLTNLTQEELLTQTKRLVQEELRIGLEVLAHIREVEKRRLYLERGYASLFAFCLGELGYSEPQAQLRISAMRALRDTPEIEEKVRSGELPVTSVVKVQQFLRREKLRTGKKPLKEERLALFQQVVGRSTREIERILVSKSPESAFPSESRRAISETHTELRLVMPEELLEKLEMLKALYSNRMKDVTSTVELLDMLASDAIRRSPSIPDGTVAPISPKVKGRRPSGRLREAVAKRDQGSCSYVDPITGRRCGSRYFLQVDHITPLAAGGETEEQNLRLLCGAHNRLAWEQWKSIHDG